MQNISNFSRVSIPCRSFSFYLTLVFSILLLSACGGGSGGSSAGGSVDTGDTGTVNPDITGSGTLNTGTTTVNVSGGVSEYTVSGLDPSIIYNVWVHDLNADIALSTYIDSGYLLSSCSSDQTGLVVEECTTASTADGKIYLKISSATSASFSVTVKTMPQNEGTVAAPVSLSLATERSSQVGIGNSYYKLSGLTPGLVYNVAMTSILLDADLSVSMLSNFSVHCLSENIGQQNESCQLPANFEGDIYIKTSGGGFGSYYALNVTATTTTERIFEGYSDAPKDLTGILPYSGQVNRANSHYMFTGLTAGVRYEVRITNNTVNTQVHFYDTLDYVGVDCSINYGFDVIAERLCVATAPASGNLYLAIPYYGTPGGTYTVDIGLAPVAEGNSTTPKIIPSTSMPYSGQVDTSFSYYVITGLTPDYIYEVQFNDKTHQYAKMSIGDSLTTFNLGCNPCTIRSNVSGEVYLRVDGTSTDNENNDLGAWFTLAFGDAENAEGSVASPVVISGDGTKYDGQVGDRTSYYSASGLIPGKYYQLYLTTDDFDKPGLFSFVDNTYTGFSNCKFLPGMCLAPADASGNLHMAVYGPDIYGLRYKVWIQPSPYSYDGTVSAPIDITGNLVTTGTPSVHSGKVSVYNTDKTEGTSYYQLSGLPGTTNYSIATSDLTDDIRLEVYADAAFSNLLCSSSRRGLYAEKCDVVSGVVGGGVKSTNLYIKVIYEEFLHGDQWDGANYTLTVSEGGAPILSEGASGAPVNVTGLLPYTAKVRKNEFSYYQLTGLTPSTDYVLKLTHPQTTLTLSIYSDIDYASFRCSIGTSEDYIQQLGCTSTASGELFIRVKGGFYTDTDFTMELVPVPVAEGTAVAPVDISSSLPYSGQANNVDTLRSFYVVSGLSPLADYVVLNQNATQSSFTNVYSNADFLTDFQCSVNGACVAQANTSGELYIRVDGYDQYGTYFDLNVKPAPVSEGSIAAPVEVALQQVYKGQATYSSSYYVVSGLTPYSGHYVGLQNHEQSHWLQIFSDVNFEHTLCDNSNEDYSTGCGATANADGKIYFKVSNGTGYYDLFIQ